MLDLYLLPFLHEDPNQLREQHQSTIMVCKPQCLLKDYSYISKLYSSILVMVQLIEDVKLISSKKRIFSLKTLEIFKIDMKRLI